VLFLIIIFYVIFSRPVFATPSVTINSAPDVITAGDTFPITFTITEASSSASYYYKFFGGVDTDVYKITNSSNLSYTSGWSDFPQIILDPGSSNVFNGVAFIKPDVDTNTLNLKIKIASTTNTKISVTSPSFPIEVVAIPPPTSTPTPNPTTVPTPTNLPTTKPTVIKIPTTAPTLTITPSTIDNLSSTVSISPTIIEEINSIDSSIIISPTKIISASPSGKVLGTNTKSSPKNFISLIFIVLGGSLLLTPLIASKIFKQ